MTLPRTRLLRLSLAILSALMLTSIALARDYVVPDEPFIIEYEGVEQAGQVALSVDGRFVAVASIEDGHVYVHDRQNNTTERVSVAVSPSKSTGATTVVPASSPFPPSRSNCGGSGTSMRRYFHHG